MVVTGLKLNGSKSAAVMAQTRPNIIYAAVGVHPHFVKDDWSEKALDALEELVKHPEVVAVGECGLDFKRDYSPRDLQETAFKKQVLFCLQFALDLHLTAFLNIEQLNLICRWSVLLCDMELLKSTAKLLDK